MNCDEAKARFLEMVDGVLPELDRQPFREHVGSCDRCRCECEELQGALAALTGSLDEIAPRGEYLTRHRLACLLSAHRSRRSAVRLVSWRGLVAAAAIAAILVSAWFIYFDVRDMLRSEEPPHVVFTGSGTGDEWLVTMPAEEAGAEETAPVSVVIGSAEPGRRFSLVHGYVVKASGGARASSGPFGRPPVESAVIRQNQPGAAVPADNLFYEFDESEYWW